MSDVTLFGENASSVPEWGEITFSVPDLPNGTTIDTTDSDVEIYVYLNPNKQWSSNYSQSVWIKVVNMYDITQNVVTWNSTDPYTYKITIPKGTDSLFPWYIRIQATVPKWTKLKALLQKITDKFLYFEKIGMAAEIHGKNSAGTGDCSLATTFKNPLAGQCQGILYGANGTATAASTSTQQNSAFIVTPSTGKIKVLEKGHYLVIASAYAYTGFTANDTFDFYVQVNGSGTARLRAVERMSGTYQIIYLIQTVGLAANAELNIAVANTTAARGIVTSGLPTTLQVMRLN